MTNKTIKIALSGVFFLSFLGMGPITDSHVVVDVPIETKISVCRAAVSKAPTWSEAEKVLKSLETKAPALSSFCRFYLQGRLDQYEIEKTWKTPVSILESPYSQHPKLKDPLEAWFT